jgi:hypothetical protein
MAKKFYSRQYLKLHYDSKIYVSIDGKHFERDYFDTKTKSMQTYQPLVHTMTSGRKAIEFKNGEIFYIDTLVLEAFRGKAPVDGKTYTVDHIDGNWDNNNLSNLKWVEETDAFKSLRSKVLKMKWYKDRHITVTADGVVRQRKQELFHSDSFYDSDMDWFYHSDEVEVHYYVKDSWGRQEKRSLKLSKIMADFGYVKGDKSQFSNPKILHINNDYTDFTSGNLEYVESSDPRYIAYKQIAHEAVMEKDHQSNSYLSELSWESVYGKDEPYRDWSDRPEKKHLCCGGSH